MLILILLGRRRKRSLLAVVLDFLDSIDLRQDGKTLVLVVSNVKNILLSKE
jgi:hypothetical protein